MPRGNYSTNRAFIWTIEAARVLAGWVSLMIGLLDPIRTSRQWLANRTLKRTLDHIRCNGQDSDKPHLLTAHGTVGPADKQRY
jgi:hypothetical protein